jgi:hypothetical protein
MRRREFITLLSGVAAACQNVRLIDVRASPTVLFVGARFQLGLGNRPNVTKNRAGLLVSTA